MIRRLLSLFAVAALAVSAASAQPGPPVRPPEGPRHPDPEIQAMIATFQAGQKALRDELNDILAALENPTPRDIAEASRAFREANAERIAAQRALADQIRDAIAQHRPDRPRPEVSPEVLALLEAFRTKQAEIATARRELHEALASASPEERASLLAAFREAQRERMDELKELRQQLRDLRGYAPGDRRPNG